jgi:tetratricopeptide (TPR) repeat protein
MIDRMSAGLLTFTVLIMVICAAVISNAQTAVDLPNGVVKENVPIKDKPGQNYSIYLPKTYSSEKHWPLIYVFDPMGRGTFAVDKYHLVAEKHGYILVGSNNSRNGLQWDELKSIIQGLWSDTHAKFAIDTQRTYAAGFSGGARVASLAAALCGTCIAGVIASGAGFSPAITLTSKIGFNFFGAVGRDDYNYTELIKLTDSLGKLGLRPHLEYFDGVHQWMPVETFEKAIVWMNIRAMQKGFLPNDEKLISDYLNSRASDADKLVSTGQLLFAAREYRSLVDDLEGLANTSAYSQRADQIDSLPQFKKAAKAETDELERQASDAQKLTATTRQTPDGQGPQASASLIISDLEKRASSEDEAVRHVAKRVLAQVYAESLESAMFTYEPQKQYDLAIANLRLATQVSPKNWYAVFQLGRAYALAHRRKNAVDSIERSIELGLRDQALIEKDDAFSELRGSDVFQKLLLKVKQQ